MRIEYFLLLAILPIVVYFVSCAAARGFYSAKLWYVKHFDEVVATINRKSVNSEKSK